MDVSVARSIVLACAVCGAAEKTLPSNGSEIPFEGRKRAPLELRAASFETTDRTLRVVELRAQPASTILAAEVPLLGAPRQAAESSAMKLGDVELSVGASFPVIQEMRGYRVTAPVPLASAAVDF